MNGKGKHSSLMGYGNNYGFKLGICDIEIEQKIWLSKETKWYEIERWQKSWVKIF